MEKIFKNYVQFGLNISLINGLEINIQQRQTSNQINKQNKEVFANLK